MRSEFVVGAEGMNYQNSHICPPSPQEAGSDGLPHTSQSTNLKFSHIRSSDDFLQTYASDNDCHLKDQPFLQHSSMPSLEGSLCMRSSSTVTSPISSETSQTYSWDSQCFQSAETAVAQDRGHHSSNDQPVSLTHLFDQLSTELLGPDNNDPKNMENTSEGHMLTENSEWSVQGLSDINDMFDQTLYPVCLQTDGTDRDMEAENLHQQPVSENHCIKVERLEEVKSKTEFCSSKNAPWEQNQVDVLGNAQKDVKCLLIKCAEAVASNNQVQAGKLIGELKKIVSIFGDPMERLGAYMLEGLIARLHSSGGRIYRALNCKDPISSELLSYMQILYELCPYFKFGYMAANGAIAEAFRDKDRLHIIDFQIAQGSQWVTLIQALAARPGGAPHIRITGVDDPVAEYARGGGLWLVGQRLSKLAETYQVPFEFHALPVFGADVDASMLEVRAGETLAVNFPLQLHHMPDESVSTSNHRDRILRMIKGLAPNVVTLVEQEANTNTAPFFPRFVETLSYYSAIFESLDVTLPRENKDRVSVEEHCLARDIVNVIACEGAERIERHELFGKWRSRLTMAGFESYPLSSHVNATIKFLLESYNENYRLVEKDDALYLGWLDRDLIVASAWK